MCHLLSVSFFFLLLCMISVSLQSSTANTNSSVFITLVDPLSKPSPFLSHLHWYSSLLYLSSLSPCSFIHVYGNLINGFSAILTLHEANRIRNSHGVLSSFPDSLFHLHTTRSPSFLGLHSPNYHQFFNSTSESDTIIGFIDTGIWPEHSSFSDHGLGPNPLHWKGECENGFGFNQTNCNRKLIGARFFSGGYEAWFVGSDRPDHEFRSPRDSDGHGTHVASIAAGALVPGSGFFGFAGGLARGMAPSSRIAVYKVCWASGCLLSDVCAAVERAVLDGVDIVSISLGSSRLPFYLDLLSIVSFRAFNRGVFVVASAGNEGPTLASITSEPPWITTVGSGTIDRDFPAKLLLGNGKLVSGISVTLKPEVKMSRDFHLLHLVGEMNSSSKFNFSHELIEGKIVVCMTDEHVGRSWLGATLKYAGAIALIISHGGIDPSGIVSEPHVIPTITVGILEAKLIKDYILFNENPTAMISSQGTIPMHARPAPIVASFSSRGPNLVVPEILKPDMIAPGVNILGAWTDAIGPSGMALDNRRSRFNIMSGTSMACPHVSGVAALIKRAHPDWGPSEIKSALMTTSTMQKRVSDHHGSFIGSSLISDESTGDIASPFDVGAGHIQPKRAMDPGLVFDSGYQDYVAFLCELNYTKKQIQIVTGKLANCSNVGETQLNYPAIVVEAEKVKHGEAVFVRRLRNVNEGSREYKPKLVGPKGDYKIGVKPKLLKFSGLGERLRFRVFMRERKSVEERKNLWFGALIWRENGGKHIVRCPIVVFSAKEYLGGY